MEQKKRVLFTAVVCLLAAAVILFEGMAFASEYKKFDIKFGMHQRNVDKVYGSPIILEKLGKRRPIFKKKALYAIDESNYMIVYYFSGRSYKITLLEDMELDEAKRIFNEN